MEVLEKPQVAEDKGVILIKALRPKTALPVKCMPCQDRSGNTYTGQGAHGYYELLTEEEKKGLPFIVTPQTTVIISDGKVLDMSRPVDKIQWKWLKKHPYIGKDKAAALSSSRVAVYYVEDVIAEAKERVAKSGDKDTARYKVRELSHDKRKRAARILGLVTADSFEEEQLLDWLLSQADFAPKSVLEAVNPDNAERGNAKIFFNEIVKYNVIQRGTDGIYRVGGDDGATLGHDSELVIDWMLNGANNEMVRVLKARLDEVKSGKL